MPNIITLEICSLLFWIAYIWTNLRDWISKAFTTRLESAKVVEFRLVAIKLI